MAKIRFNNVELTKSVGTTSVIPPVVWAEQKILASDAAGNDAFGSTVAMSEDGTTAIVGAYVEDATGFSDAGSAYIFTQVGGIWLEEQKLIAGDPEGGGYFGWAVSLSGDGNTAIVGAYGEDTVGAEAGAAYIFTRSGGVWTQQQKLQASDIEQYDRFGYSVSISSDGNTAIIGAYGESAGGILAGAAYIFTQSGGVWTEQQKILASDAQASDNFGWSVSISSDGNTAIVGSYGEDTGGSLAGSAYMYTRSGGVWTQQQKIQASDVQGGDRFGYTVSMSSDGNTAIIGAYHEDTGASGAGSAYIFTQSGGVWTQQQKIQASDAEATDYFGYKVSMSSDGNTAIIGAYLEDTGAISAGAAYIFTSSGGVWTQQQKLQASDKGEDDRYGSSVYISGDGTKAIVGSPREDAPLGNQGASYIYEIQ